MRYGVSHWGHWKGWMVFIIGQHGGWLAWNPHMMITDIGPIRVMPRHWRRWGFTQYHTIVGLDGRPSLTTLSISPFLSLVEIDWGNVDPAHACSGGTMWGYSYMESLCCDSAFAHKKEFFIFKFPKGFSEISWGEISQLHSTSLQLDSFLDSLSKAKDLITWSLAPLSCKAECLAISSQRFPQLITPNQL